MGKTEAAVRHALGQPHVEFAGHFGAPPLDFTRKFTGEVKTLVFRDADSETYVSFEKRGDNWVCICSMSVPRGAVF